MFLFACPLWYDVKPFRFWYDVKLFCLQIWADWCSRRPFHLEIAADWCSRRPFFAFANSSCIGSHAVHFFYFRRRTTMFDAFSSPTRQFLFWEPLFRIHFGPLETGQVLI